ncbi:unnamed protein product [Caenorhabditis angaria]|uniref:Uncharacterized protein n=1 Tax=Caenorhabditis angaria TaxID=860376 RepID=A0A9P1I6B0_9PELO|nr:unnamed protein product [Caenorhabditis angaria]
MPSAPSTSGDGQRRSARQRIDLSHAEEGFDRHELELALRASFNEANKHGLFEEIPATSSFSSKPQKSAKSKKGSIPPVEKKKIGKKEAKRISAKKTAITPKKEVAAKKKKETVVAKVEPKKAETKKAAKVVEEKKVEKKKEETKKKVGPVKKKTESKYERRQQTSDFITLLACAKKVLGDH